MCCRGTRVEVPQVAACLSSSSLIALLPRYIPASVVWQCLRKTCFSMLRSTVVSSENAAMECLPSGSHTVVSPARPVHLTPFPSQLDGLRGSCCSPAYAWLDLYHVDRYESPTARHLITTSRSILSSYPHHTELFRKCTLGKGASRLEECIPDYIISSAVVACAEVLCDVGRIRATLGKSRVRFVGKDFSPVPTRRHQLSCYRVIDLPNIE